MSFGDSMSKFVTFLLDMSVFGDGVPNLLVASQNMQLLGMMLGDSAVNISYCYWLIILGVILCPIMWIGSPKDMKWVSVISVDSVFGVALLTWTNMLIDPSSPATVQIPKPSWESFAIAYGILDFQFDIHPMVLTVQVDMRNKADLGDAIMWSFIEFNWKRCLTRSCLLFLMVVIGEFVSRFDLIMSPIGGALTGPLMFVFPPLLYIRYRYLQAQQITKSPQTALSEEIISERYIRPPEYNPYYKIYYVETESVFPNHRYNQNTEFDGEFDSMEYSGNNDCSTLVVPHYGSIESRPFNRAKDAIDFH